MVFKGPKRKRKREHAKQELQLKRKRARSDKLQQRQGPLFEDAGEEEVVFKKKFKLNKKGSESNPVGTEGQNEVDPNDSSRSGHSKSSMDEQCMNSECRENGHTQSSKEGQDLNLESIDIAHPSIPKKRKKEQKSKSERSTEGQQSNSKSIGKKHSVKSESSIQGQDVPDAKYNNDETLKVSADVKERKKKKKKKKRDRWGQVLDDGGNTQDTPNDDISAMPDNVGELKNAAHEVGDEAFIKNDIHKGEYDNKTVSAGGMPYDTSEEDIWSFFKECGTVARVVCMKFADTQRFKGLAFITFETQTAALKALSLDGANIGGRLIKVEKARVGGKVLQAPPKREAGCLSVYVGNLDWGVQKIDIKRFFKGCDIDNVRLAVDRNTGDFRGYGHVDFSNEKSLEKAIKMDQKQLLGRPVKVSYAVPKGFKGKSSQMQ